MSDDSTLRIAQALHFAAVKHVDQRRKGERAEPYFNHLAEVAWALARHTGGSDPDLVIAGLLHDTLEDTDATFAEVEAAFGAEVAGLVREVTDDKSLPKAERKRLQVVTAPTKSVRARMIKIADKTCNLRAIVHSPPAWSRTRRREYAEWAKAVFDGCRGVNAGLEAEFLELYEEGRTALAGE